MRPTGGILLSQTNTGTIHSAVIDSNFLVSGSIQAAFTDGTAAGTLKLEGSNDAPSAITSGGTPVPVNWNTVANGTINATATIASGATTTISMQWLNSRWLRVTWTQSGGAGTITVSGQFQAT